MVYKIKEPKKDTRSALGRRVDVLVGLFLIWLVSFMLLANLTGKLITALVSSIPLLAAEALVLQKFLNIRERRRQLQRRLWLAGQKLMEDISKMDPQKEFKNYVRDIIAGLPGFQGVKLKPAKEKGTAGEERGIDIRGFYKGVPVAIQCRRPEGDKKITPSDIRAFAGAMQVKGYKNGLFITSGEFGLGTARVVAELSRKGINIKPVNRYGLMELARRANSGAFQNGEPNSGGSSPAARERLSAAVTILRDSIFSSREKAKSYFLFGLLLYGGYLLLRNTTYLSMVYLFFATLNVLMGAACLYLGRGVEERDPLKGLGPDE